MTADKRSTIGLCLAALVALPPLVGLGYALMTSLGLTAAPNVEPSTRHFKAVIGDHATWAGLGFTLWIALASTFVATLVAVLLATTFRAKRKADRLAWIAAILPLPIPHVVAALSSLLILSQSGLLARIAHSTGLISAPAEMPPLVYDQLGFGLIVALVWKEVPFLALIAFTLVQSRGTSLEDTARSLGAGSIQTFLHATWPLLWRGMLPGIVAVATFVAGSYETAALLAPSRPLALPLLTMERYTDASLELRPEAFVLTGFTLLISLLAVCVYGVLVARMDRLQ